jgi:hypothetical protein
VRRTARGLQRAGAALLRAGHGCGCSCARNNEAAGKLFLRGLFLRAPLTELTGAKTVPDQLGSASWLARLSLLTWALSRDSSGSLLTASCTELYVWQRTTPSQQRQHQQTARVDKPAGVELRQP